MNFICYINSACVHVVIISHSSSTVDSHREPVPDAVAVYFVVPTASTINRLCRDCHSHLYDSMYFNFITPIGRPLLEELAKATVDSNSSTSVMKVPCYMQGFMKEFAPLPLYDMCSLEIFYFVCRSIVYAPALQMSKLVYSASSCNVSE